MSSEFIILDIQHYHDPTMSKLSMDASATVGKLVANIMRLVEPTKTHRRLFRTYLQIDDEAQFLFQGKDLRRSPPQVKIRDMGMEGWAVVSIIHPGRFRQGLWPHKTEDLKCLALSVREAVEHGTLFDKFVEDSCDTKVIFVEIPISEDMDLLISVNIKLTDQICDVKKIIERNILDKCNGCDFDDYFIRLGAYTLLSRATELDPMLTLAEYDVKEHDKLKLSWKSEGIDLLLPGQINGRMDPRIVNISSFDTVGKLKAQIGQVTCIPSKNQLLRYQNRFLVNDSKILEEYGINFYFGKIFRWCRQAQISGLEIFPSVDWAKTSKNCGLFPCVPSSFAFDAGATSKVEAGATSFLIGSFRELGVETSTGDEGCEIGEGNEFDQSGLRKLFLLETRRLYDPEITASIMIPSSSLKKRKLNDPEIEKQGKEST